MASYNGHVTSDQTETQRREEDIRDGKMLPAPVEAVLLFGYPPGLVLSTYRQLLSARVSDSHNPLSGSGAGNGPSRDVSAATLLAAVEDEISHGNASSSGADAANPSFNEERMSRSEEVEMARSADETPSTSSENCNPDQGTADNPPSSSIVTSPNTSAETPRSVSETTLWSSSGSTPRTADGSESNTESSASATSHAVTAYSFASVVDTSAGMDTGHLAASPSIPTPRSAPASPSIPTPESTAASPSINPIPESTPASRVRSSERGEEGQGEEGEWRARERRRQLDRLRALRAENRRLKARQTCRHCRHNPVALTLLPCGHFCLCQECGASYEACPVCGKTILADVKTFVC